MQNRYITPEILFVADQLLKLLLKWNLDFIITNREESKFNVYREHVKIITSFHWSIIVRKESFSYLHQEKGKQLISLTEVT